MIKLCIVLACNFDSESNESDYSKSDSNTSMSSIASDSDDGSINRKRCVSRMSDLASTASSSTLTTISERKFTIDSDAPFKPGLNIIECIFRREFSLKLVFRLQIIDFLSNITVENA